MYKAIALGILALTAMVANSAWTQAQSSTDKESEVLPKIFEAGPQFTTEFFDVIYTTRHELYMKKYWDDADSGATRGVYLHMPCRGYFTNWAWQGVYDREPDKSKILDYIQPSDYMLLGDYGFSGADEKEDFVDNGIKARHVSIALRVKPKYRDQNLLVEPVSYKQVWSDAGSGASKDVKIFEMIPPDGYVAMGMLFSDDIQRPTQPYRCIKKNAVYTNKNGKKVTVDLVREIKYLSEDKEKPVGFWDDRGSGATANVALYKVAAPTGKIPKNTIQLVPNVFFAADNYEKFPKSTPYALTLFVEESGVSSKPTEKELPNLPTLTSHAEQPESEEIVTEFKLPYYKVKDSKYSSAIAQALFSPVYTATRTSKYIPAVHTKGAADGTELEYTVEMAEEKTENWSKSDSVEVSASVMIGAEVEASFLGSGGKATIQVTAGVAYTGTTAWGGELSTSKAKAPALKIPVKNGQTAVIYEVVHEYKFTRADGTEVPEYDKKEVDGATGFQAAFYPENK